jgi:hypothetical protein
MIASAASLRAMHGLAVSTSGAWNRDITAPDTKGSLQDCPALRFPSWKIGLT